MADTAVVPGSEDRAAFVESPPAEAKNVGRPRAWKTRIEALGVVA